MSANTNLLQIERKSLICLNTQRERCTKDLQNL